MENTLLIGLSRQLVTQRQMDVIANNLANTSSPGYKSEQMMFAAHIKKVGRDTSLAFVQDIALARNMGAGEFQKTDNKLDVAIKGQGWFVVETKDGERYTRNGHFELNRIGQLTTSAGNLVQGVGVRGFGGNDNAITFRPGDKDIVIKGDGTITVDGRKRGQLKIVAFEEMQKMQKVSGNMYRSDSEQKPATDMSIVQGMLEKSNVRPIIEITNMIKALRGYQGVQKLIEREHELQRAAIQKLTREPS